MENVLKRTPEFIDIVFEFRNKKYGAYLLRKRYYGNVLISMFIGIGFMGAAVLIPYYNAKALERSRNQASRQVEIRLENLDMTANTVIPPATPPPPAAESAQQAKYVPPVVVDSVGREESDQFMTADQATVEVRDIDVNIEVVAEVGDEITEEVEPEPFVVVEEMPVFPGGLSELYKFIGKNLVYPEVARENNITGRVIVKFCITPTGGTDRITILKGVDDELNAEAIRVVSILPPFKPGKQGGKPVPVWYTLPVMFKLAN